MIVFCLLAVIIQTRAATIDWLIDELSAIKIILFGLSVYKFGSVFFGMKDKKISDSSLLNMDIFWFLSSSMILNQISLGGGKKCCDTLPFKKWHFLRVNNRQAGDISLPCESFLHLVRYSIFLHSYRLSSLPNTPIFCVIDLLTKRQNTQWTNLKLDFTDGNICFHVFEPISLSILIIV